MSSPDPERMQAILDLDRLVHEPARLAILTVLASAEEVDFLFLQQITGLTKGNLSAHAQKLEAGGYLASRKFFRGRIPATCFAITPEGRTALEAYHRQLRSLLPKDGKR